MSTIQSSAAISASTSADSKSNSKSSDSKQTGFAALLNNFQAAVRDSSDAGLDTTKKVSAKKDTLSADEVEDLTVGSEDGSKVSSKDTKQDLEAQPAIEPQVDPRTNVIEKLKSVSDQNLVLNADSANEYVDQKITKPVILVSDGGKSAVSLLSGVVGINGQTKLLDSEQATLKTDKMPMNEAENLVIDAVAKAAETNNQSLQVMQKLSQVSNKDDLARQQEAVGTKETAQFAAQNPVFRIPSLHQNSISANGTTRGTAAVNSDKTRHVQISASTTEGKSDAAAQGLDIRTQNFVGTLMDSKALAQKLQAQQPGQTGSADQTQANLMSPRTGTGTGAESQIASTLLAPATGAAQSVSFNPMIPQYGVATQITHPGWAQAMSHQLLSFVRKNEQGIQEAQLRLDPPELGPLKVSISIKDGVASASFVSANPAVRAAVEQALPQLAQNMSDSGLTLGQTDVGEQSHQSSGDFAQRRDDNDGDKQRTLASSGSEIGSKSELQSTDNDILSKNRPHQGLVRAYA